MSSSVVVEGYNPSNPPSGGDTLDLAISGFDPGEYIAVEIESATPRYHQFVDFFPADATGATHAAVTLPNWPEGNYRFVVSGDVGQSAEAPFTMGALSGEVPVDPPAFGDITFEGYNPENPPVGGGTETVIGSGFGAGEMVTLILVNADPESGPGLVQPLGETQANAAGEIRATRTMPPVGAGAAILEGSGETTGIVAEFFFYFGSSSPGPEDPDPEGPSTPPSVEIDGSGTFVPGEQVVFSGEGFMPGEDLEYYLDQGFAAMTRGPDLGFAVMARSLVPAFPILLGTGTADENGAFSDPLEIPEVPAGLYSLSAVGVDSGVSSSVAITIEEGESPEEPAPAAITLPGYDEADPPLPGDSVAIAGSGYEAGESVTITLEVGASGLPFVLTARGGPAVVGSATADAEGAFSSSFDIPGGTSPGLYTVRAAGDDSERSATTVLRVGEADDPDPEPHPDRTAITDITRTGCTVTITMFTDSAGDYMLKVWDDGEEVDIFKWTADEPGYHVSVWIIDQPAGDQVPGVGFYLYDATSSAELAYVDPYLYPAEVADNCAATGQPTPPEKPTDTDDTSVAEPTDEAEEVPSRSDARAESPAAVEALPVTGPERADLTLLAGSGLVLLGAAALLASRRRV